VVQRPALLVAIILVASSLGTAGGVHAQDASAQHPADIRAGSCAGLGEVVVPLTSTVVPQGEAQGQDGATPVEQSASTIPMLLDDLLATGHALAVYASPEQAGAPIACGEIGGALASDGSLAVGLNAMNESKSSGVAFFLPQDDGSTTVIVLLVEERSNRRGDDGANAGAAPADDPAAPTGAPADSANLDDASGASGAVAAPAVTPMPAPPATAGVDGTATIGADNVDGKADKPERNKDKAVAERDAHGNAGTATTDSADTGKEDRAGRRGGRDGKDDAAHG
jgi:hypothetical protein